MAIVWITAFAVGLSTLFGSLLSFWVGGIPERASNALMSFAAGIMLSASFVSLILPGLTEGAHGGEWINYLQVSLGVLGGGALISIADRLVPHMHAYMGAPGDYKDMDKVILFVLAIAIHNFPEGIAVGVSFASDDIGNAMGMALGISLQNIPEGMVTIMPLLMAGVPKSRAFAIALFTGMVEVVGVMVGYLAVHISSAILPFILALAGGAMLFVISHDMIPETHSDEHDKLPTYSLLAGVVVMLIIEYAGELLV